MELSKKKKKQQQIVSTHSFFTLNIELILVNKLNFFLKIFFKIIGGTLQTIFSPYRARKPQGLYLKSCLNTVVIRPSLKQSLLSSSFPLPQNKSIQELFSLPKLVIMFSFFLLLFFIECF